MRNWFLGQGIPMYAEAILMVAGLFTLWMTGRIYKRLIREADLMGTSNQRLIKYIKLKVTSYYKIGMHPEDTQALIGRYIKKIPGRPFFAAGLEPSALSLDDGDACHRRRKPDVSMDQGRGAVSDSRHFWNVGSRHGDSRRPFDVYGFWGKGKAADKQYCRLCGQLSWQ